MFKPVSFNVIRQVLAWEQIPKPANIRMLSSFKWQDGSTSAEILLTWQGHEVTRHTDRAALYDGSAAYTEFVAALRECFCPDIQPVAGHYEVGFDRLTVELHCHVSANSPDQLPLPLEV